MHGVGNILRPGDACRNTARVNMWVVALDVQGVGKYSQSQNSYRSTLHRYMNERGVEDN